MLINFFFIYCILSESKDISKTYSFMDNHKRSFTLQDPSVYLQSNPSFFSQIFGKKALDDEYFNKKEWYYIHFSTQNIPEIQNNIELKSIGQMLKNTYLVYITKSQLQKISNISLAKRLEPEDKILYNGGLINQTNYFLVTTSPQFQLPPNPDYYTVEKRWFEDIYIIRVDRNQLNDQQFNAKKEKVVNIISTIPSVKSISTYTKPKPNNNVAPGFTQKNSKNFIQNNNTGITVLNRYFNNLNITGEGEVITVIDTLIDIYHSMFRDNKVNVTFSEPIINHRKFVYYGYPYDLNTWIQNIEANEHGTHVSGSAAGKNDCSLVQDKTEGPELFDGNAPDAKILYAGGLNNVSVEEQLELMIQYNSKISTNSWGVDGFNDEVNYMYGMLSYIDPGSIFVYAAGNAYESDGNFSVCDPGGSKNVLTVGALGEFYKSEHIYILSNLQNPSINVELNTFIDAEPYQIGTIGETPLESTIVLIDAGAPNNNCDTIDQPQISLLYAENSNQFDWVYNCNIEKSNGILYTYGIEQLQAVVNAGPDVYLQDITGYNNTPGVTHAPYSSTGPANKGILKPDIMAPGTRIISAKSLKNSHEDHGCNTISGNALIFMQGTSMATPNAAGATALIRQYFKNNWSVSSVDLDGPTVRALMINSCIQQPQGSLTPNTMFGHGHLDLSTVLPVDKNFGVQITNLASIKQNSQQFARINVKSNKVKLQVTLSYLDPMINPTTYIPITRDLDLIVRSSSNKIYKGDHLPNGDTQHFSTNEKVIINTDQIEPGEYYIQVYSLEFLDLLSTSEYGEYQNFSVVVTGDVDDGFLDFSESRACGCDRCMEERPLHCKCDNETFGEICQSKIDIMTEEIKTYDVPSLLLQLVRIESDNPIKTIGLAANGLAAQHVKAFVDAQCHLNIGEYPIQMNVGQDNLRATELNFHENSVCIGLFNDNYEETKFTIEKDFVESDSNKRHKLSKGHIAGIVIGCVLGVALIIGLTIYLIRRCSGGVRDF